VIEGNQSPDRNAQFEHINATVNAAIARGQPVISVDTKKKECASSKGWLVKRETVPPGQESEAP